MGKDATTSPPRFDGVCGLHGEPRAEGVRPVPRELNLQPLGELLMARWRSLLGALALASCFPASSPGIAHPRILFVYLGGRDQADQTDYAKLIPGHLFDRLAEYGVGTGTLLPPITSQAVFPNPVPDADLLASVAREVGPRGANDIVVILLPPGYTTSILGAASAYHTGIYAIIGNGGISHELYEIAAHQEIADMCENQLDTIDGVLVQKVWSHQAMKCL